MRAMHVTSLGAPLVPADLPPPEPAAGEVLLRVHACGVNFADTLMRDGLYQEKPSLPFVPGMEVCGIVVGHGAGIKGPPVGNRVACFTGRGGFAEFVAVSADLCVPVPEAMPDAVAAGFLVAYGTAHLALDHRASLKSGETLLVLGAAGGVGLAAVEVGKLMGARVIASARGRDRLAIAEAAGADHLIDAADDLRDAVKRLGGADVVYDPVGGDLFDAALRATRPGGRLLPLGFASGRVPQIPANILLVKNLTVHGLYWSAYAGLQPAAMTSSIATLLGWYADGRLRPHVSEVLPLEEAETALAKLKERSATGKIVLRIDR